MIHKPLPDEFLREIGLINVRWSSFEAVLGIALIAVLGKELHEGRSHVIFAHVSFPQKLDILSALIAELITIPTSLQRYREDIKPLLTKASKERNKVAHSVWDVFEGNVTRASISARGELKMQNYVVRLTDLEEVASNIQEAEDALLKAVFGHEDQFRNEDNLKELH